MNKKKKFQLKSKHLLFIMTFLCLSGILGSAADKMPVTPIREAAGFVIIPFQNGINQIGAYLTDCLTGFQNVKISRSCSVFRSCISWTSPTRNMKK